MKITDIIPAPWNTRSAITDESVRSLAETMKNDGLITPISVCDNPDGDGYICYDGNRRLAAAKLLGWKEIATTYEAIDQDRAMLRTITANFQREADDPLLAAGVIAKKLDEGMDAKTIAGWIGQSVTWVNRRRKMIGAADALKECANKVTIEVLERVAVLPESVQKRVCKEIVTKAGYLGTVKLGDIRYTIEREMRDLDEAKFNTECCARCAKRTGVEADLFGECEPGKLGKCLDCKCFDALVAAYEKAEIVRLVGDAEVVRVKYTWELPGEDVSAKKRTKKYPCAYVCVCSDGIEVRWAESAKARAEREAEENAAKEAERAERAEHRDRMSGITDALEEIKDDDVAVRGIIERAMEANDENAMAHLVEVAVENIASWHSESEWATLLRVFPELGEKANLSDQDVEWFLNENPETDDDE